MSDASIDQRGPCADRLSPGRRSIEVDDHDRAILERGENGRCKTTNSFRALVSRKKSDRRISPSGGLRPIETVYRINHERNAS